MAGMKPSNRRKALLFLAFAAGAAIMVVAGNRVGHELAHRRDEAAMADRVARMNDGDATGLRAGELFPAVVLTTPANQNGVTARVDSHTIVAGREALVFFLSEDCEPCTQAARRWSDPSAQVPAEALIVGIIDQPPAVRDRYVAQHQISFPVLSDSADVFGREYGVEVYPTLVGVDANGTMVFVRHGMDDGFTPGVALELLRAGIGAGN